METPQRPAFPATVGSAPANLMMRAAAPADAQTIASIYSEGIRGRAATFETAERTPEDILAWFTPTSATAVPYPFLVAELGDGVVGWVRASSYRPRDAYRQIAEYSVYVATAAQGQRVGDTLLAAFLTACETAGISKLVSRIFPENGASLALCARHGFRVVGTYERHAALDGVWRDVVIVERLFPNNLR